MRLRLRLWLDRQYYGTSFQVKASGERLDPSRVAVYLDAEGKTIGYCRLDAGQPQQDYGLDEIDARPVPAEHNIQIEARQ
jgi:hypothetical protein